MSKPYEKKAVIGLATLYLGDSRVVLPKRARKGDIVITDPPYGIAMPCAFAGRGRAKPIAGGSSVVSANDYADVHGDDEPFDPDWLVQLKLRMILWGANFYADKLPTCKYGWLVWDKDRSDKSQAGMVELAWTNFVCGNRKFTHMWNGFIRASEREKHYHPTQKPVALFDWVVGLRWVKPDWRVLDPYMGAGPCGVAAVRAGHEYVGVEIVKSYFDIACRRIRKAQGL